MEVIIISIASSNCDNFHNFPLKIELFETHVARLLLFDITLHDFQNLVKIIRFWVGNDGWLSQFELAMERIAIDLSFVGKK